MSARANTPDFAKLADRLSAALDAARAVRSACSEIEGAARADLDDHRQGLAHAALLAADGVDRMVIPAFEVLCGLADERACEAESATRAACRCWPRIVRKGGAA